MLVPFRDFCVQNGINNVVRPYSLKSNELIKKRKIHSKKMMNVMLVSF